MNEKPKLVVKHPISFGIVIGLCIALVCEMVGCLL